MLVLDCGRPYEIVNVAHVESKPIQSNRMSLGLVGTHSEFEVLCHFYLRIKSIPSGLSQTDLHRIVELGESMIPYILAQYLHTVHWSHCYRVYCRRVLNGFVVVL